MAAAAVQVETGGRSNELVRPDDIGACRAEAVLVVAVVVDFARRCSLRRRMRSCCSALRLLRNCHRSGGGGDLVLRVRCEWLQNTSSTNVIII